jgi:hypothetical protein
MNVTGSCHCGNVQYTADVDPSHVSICHCTDCQTLAGSAFRVSAAAKFDSFKLTRGEPKKYVKTAESGAKRVHGFCGDCGTPIYSVAPVDPKFILLRVGAIQERKSLPPTKQIWLRSAVAWRNDLHSIPGSPEQQALTAK